MILDFFNVGSSRIDSGFVFIFYSGKVEDMSLYTFNIRRVFIAVFTCLFLSRSDQGYPVMIYLSLVTLADMEGSHRVVKS